MMSSLCSPIAHHYVIFMRYPAAVFWSATQVCADLCMNRHIVASLCCVVLVPMWVTKFTLDRYISAKYIALSS